MIFHVETKKFILAVQNASLALPIKAVDSRYEKLHIKLKGNELYILADGGDISISIKLNVEVEKDGSFEVEAKWLYDAISLLDSERLSIVEDKKENARKLVIKTESGEYSLATSDSEIIGDVEKVDFISFSLKAKDLKRISEKTISFASHDSMRISMTGILFEANENALNVVATDGHRLIRFSKKFREDSQNTKGLYAVIPSKAISIAQKVFSEDLDQEITMCLDENQKKLYVEGERALLSINLISEKYPNYTSVIPLNNDKELLLAKETMIGAVKRAEKFSSRGDVRISLKGNNMVISAENPDRSSSSKETMSCVYDGEDMDIGFNSRFLQDALTNLDDSDVLFKLSSPTSAVTLNPKNPEENDEDTFMLIMPIRVNM